MGKPTHIPPHESTSPQGGSGEHLGQSEQVGQLGLLSSFDDLFQETSNEVIVEGVTAFLSAVQQLSPPKPRYGMFGGPNYESSISKYTYNQDDGSLRSRLHYYGLQFNDYASFGSQETSYRYEFARSGLGMAHISYRVGDGFEAPAIPEVYVWLNLPKDSLGQYVRATLSTKQGTLSGVPYEVEASISRGHYEKKVLDDPEGVSDSFSWAWIESDRPVTDDEYIQLALLYSEALEASTLQNQDFTDARPTKEQREALEALS